VKRAVALLAPPLLSLTALLVLAEVLIRALALPAYLAPAPSAVLATLVREAAPLSRATTETAMAAAAGFAASAIVGFALAVVLSASRWVQRAFYPYAIFFQTVPIVAIAPLLVIWLGTGLRAVTASAFVVSVFPVLANALTGLRSVDPALADLFRLHRAGALATLWKLRLPSALPSILTGLRIAAGLAVIGAIVGEFVAGGGLGTMVRAAIPVQRPDLVFASVLCASMLGLALFGLVNLVSWRLLAGWHASETD